MKLFIDANVIISVLNKEYPVFTFSSRVLSLADDTAHQLYTSPLCLAIAFYFSSKKNGDRLAKKKIGIIATYIGILSINEEITRQALNDPRAHDFEDGLQYYAAINEGCNVVITENKQDFYFSEVPVCNCEEFINRYYYL
ncbi:MAG: PIN domain-containing protein [Bacteroidota bacterium]